VTSISLNRQSETAARNLEMNTRRENESTRHIFSQPPRIRQCIESYGVDFTAYLPIHPSHLLYHPSKPPHHSYSLHQSPNHLSTLLPFTSHTPLSSYPYSTTSHRIRLRRRVGRRNRRSPRLAVWPRRLLCEAEYNGTKEGHDVFWRAGEGGIGSGL
jgi:hypothetical protein